MKKYIDIEGFLQFLKDLKEGEYSKVYTESIEGEINEYNFLKINFNGYPIILHDNPVGDVGVIQDSLYIPYQDYAEELFEVLEDNGECKVFIKEGSER